MDLICSTHKRFTALAQHNGCVCMCTYFDVAPFARIAARTLAGKSADMVRTLATVQARIRLALVVLEVAQFTGESWIR